MDRQTWVDQLVVELEALGVILGALELFKMANELWMSSKDDSPQVVARELFGEK